MNDDDDEKSFPSLCYEIPFPRRTYRHRTRNLSRALAGEGSEGATEGPRSIGKDRHACHKEEDSREIEESLASRPDGSSPAKAGEAKEDSVDTRNPNAAEDAHGTRVRPDVVKTVQRGLVYLFRETWRCYYEPLELNEARYLERHEELLSKVVTPQLIPAIRCLLEAEGIRANDSTVSVIVDTLLSLTESYEAFLALEKQSPETSEEHLATAFCLFSGVRTDLVNMVQMCFVRLFRSAWYDHVREHCWGCRDQLGNQEGHTCTFCLDAKSREKYYRDHFHAIARLLVTPRLIPAIQWFVRAEGMPADELTVRAIVDTLLTVMSSYDAFEAVDTRLSENLCEGDAEDRFARLRHRFNNYPKDEANKVDEEDTLGS